MAQEIKIALMNPEGTLKQQPVATPQMALDAGLQRDVDGTRDWKHGTFGCANDPVTCAVSCFVPCLTYARNKSRYEALHNTGQPAAVPEIINRDTLVYTGINCFTGLAFVLTGWLRENTRTRYNIKGDLVSDMLLSCCCHPCVLTQQSLELSEEETALGNNRGGF